MKCNILKKNMIMPLSKSGAKALGMQCDNNGMKKQKEAEINRKALRLACKDLLYGFTPVFYKGKDTVKKYMNAYLKEAKETMEEV